MRRYSVFVLLVLSVLVAGRAWAADQVGIVLMHGKWGSPDRGIVTLASRLAAAGYLVERPEMPWSGKRGYDGDYAGAMGDIDKAVAALKDRGAGRIVIAGQSLGANAAIGYGARRGDIAAIMALAPGHAPDLARVRFADGVAKARALVGDGRGDEMANFQDLNQGQEKIVSMRARVYLTYFDPDGDAIMPVNAARFMTPIPFLVVVGTADPIFPRGEEYLFRQAPPHPSSRYLVVEANHFSTPDVAAGQIIEWLQQTLP